MAATDEFLNPKSMLTPGIAGGLTMLITNALVKQFDLPGSWTSLIVSFLFGLVVFAAPTLVFPLRIVFYLINSLIIFSVAVGTNSAGGQTQKSEASHLQVTSTGVTRTIQVALDAEALGVRTREAGLFQSWFSEPEDFRLTLVPRTTAPRRQ
jgi:hypothetical protein